jgi:hypothetical protein
VFLRNDFADSEENIDDSCSATMNSLEMFFSSRLLLLLCTGGNRRFHVLVDINLGKCAASKTKIEKTILVVGMLDATREASKGGGFVKQARTRIIEIG